MQITEKSVLRRVFAKYMCIKTCVEFISKQKIPDYLIFLSFRLHKRKTIL